MYARVTFAPFLPDKMDDAVRLFRDSYLPNAAQQKGNQGGYLLLDRSTGKGIAISLWETEADMAAAEATSHRQALAMFKDFVAAPPVTENYEVSARP